MRVFAIVGGLIALVGAFTVGCGPASNAGGSASSVPQSVASPVPWYLTESDEPSNVVQSSTTGGNTHFLACVGPVLAPIQADIAFYTDQLDPAIQRAIAAPATTRTEGAMLARGLTQLHASDAALQAASCTGDGASIVAEARILHTDLERATSLASQGMVTGDAALIRDAGQSIQDTGDDASRMSTLLREAGY